MFLGMDWLESANPVKYWVAYSLELTVGAKQHTVLALLVKSITNVTLSSVKQVLAEVKHSCPACFSLFHPYTLLDTKGLLPILWGKDNTKVLSTDPLCSQLIKNEFSDVF